MAEAPTLSGRVVVVVLSSYVWLHSQKRRVVIRGGGLLRGPRFYLMLSIMRKQRIHQLSWDSVGEGERR